MHIAILGRQPALGMAELEKIHGSGNVGWFSDGTAVVETDDFNLERLGGTLKAGRIVLELPRGDWRQASMKIVRGYSRQWADFDGKITLGISAYGFGVSPREVQKTGIVLKQKLKENGVSLRLLPNTDAVLSTATSHHNKLGTANNKVELLVVRARNGKIIVAESIGTQNITAYTRRDQERPKRDAFVGMLPPKLAQIMINLATSSSSLSQSELAGTKFSGTSAARVSSDAGARFETRREAVSGNFGGETVREDIRLLDPFCGTGVILQEAALMGYAVYGTDLSEKMVDYSQKNLEWLAVTHHLDISTTIHQGDAMTTKWQQPISAVACEAYLGQPFSAPPSPAKLAEVQKNCDYIISSFLKNIAPQLAPSTPLCVGIPAWRDRSGNFTRLPLIKNLARLGFVQCEFKNVAPEDLLYYREDQVVARELLVLKKA